MTDDGSTLQNPQTDGGAADYIALLQQATQAASTHVDEINLKRSAAEALVRQAQADVDRLKALLTSVPDNETRVRELVESLQASAANSQARITEILSQVETAGQGVAAAQVRVLDDSKATAEIRSKAQGHLEEASSAKAEAATAATQAKEHRDATSADVAASKELRARAEALVADIATERTQAEEARREAEAAKTKTAALADVAAGVEERVAEHESRLREMLARHSTALDQLHSTQLARLGDLHASSEKRTQDFLDLRTEESAALLSKINGLLPGATSAGLAAAFNERKAEHVTSQRRWAGIFVVALALFALAAGIGAGILEVPSLFHVAPIPTNADWREWAVWLVRRFAILGPALWFAIFANRRYNIIVRLEEEYAHKVAMSKSFEGYKRELQGIKAEEGTLAKHAESLIYTLGRSPVRLYDGKGTDTPLEALGEQSGKTVGGLLKLLEEMLRKLK